MNARRHSGGWLIGGVLALLGMISPGLFSTPICKYKNSEPEKGYLIRNVPFEKWLEKNYCGPACLSMVLNYWDAARSFSQQKIKDDIHDSEDQTTYNSEMVLYPRTKGFASYSFQGDLRILKEVVGKGIPVIVLTRTVKQIPKGHYRVVIGFDDREDQIIFHDPFLGGRQAMTSRNFMEACDLGKGRSQSRWMLAVVPAQGTFPFPALRNDALTAINLATAYYRRSDFMKSREQWQKVKDSDPFSIYCLAMLNLREGKAEEAEAYALKAVSMDVNSAYAHDVLGMAYAKQEKIGQALHSLAQAVRLAPEEMFIRKHYQQVRSLGGAGALLDNINK